MPAQAAPAGANCDRLYQQYAANGGDGYIRAYDGVDCTQQIGAAQGDDDNWNDASGPFRSPSNDKATSLLNTGTYSGGVNNVQFWENAGPTGHTGCLRRGELYADDLRDNVLAFGASKINANNKISSHRWSSGCTNPLT
ncbi:hypothetical protein [Streptomyces longispororuber]|uniref:hypothetical protein n=1 Tax=Streptomyces longispororuber TaxID=68230 RepID=UPI0021093999|nr:hypothetical protein [Streptomyces longispororuber]MCQ4205731.1 hypothetical protein [Streptomyces longispororuber]